MTTEPTPTTPDAARLADERQRRVQDIYDWLAKLNSVKSYTDLRTDMGTLMNITHGYLNRATELIDVLRTDLAAANERVTALETQLTDAHIENEYWRAAVRIEPPPAAPSEPQYLPVKSDTTDWGALPLGGVFRAPHIAQCDSSEALIHDSQREYTAEPPAAAKPSAKPAVKPTKAQVQLLDRFIGMGGFIEFADLDGKEKAQITRIDKRREGNSLLPCFKWDHEPNQRWGYRITHEGREMYRAALRETEARS